VRGIRLVWSQEEQTMVVVPEETRDINQALTDVARACGFNDTLRRTATTAYLHALEREGAGVLERLRRHSPYTEEETHDAP
jgi:hypothetical protein